MQTLKQKLLLFAKVICVVLATAIVVTACGDECKKNNIMNNSCEFENPLTDLSWLKDKVDEITLLFQGNSLHIAIYQCTYGDGETGFLLDQGNLKPFYNCNGVILCTMGGFMGETCPGLKIDLENKKLIWEINN